MGVLFINGDLKIKKKRSTRSTGHKYSGKLCRISQTGKDFKVYGNKPSIDFLSL